MPNGVSAKKNREENREKIRLCLVHVLRTQGPDKTPGILCQTLHTMADIAMQDPNSRAKDQQFQLWSEAIGEFLDTRMSAFSLTFEQHLTDEGRAFAAKVGIRLD